MVISDDGSATIDGEPVPAVDDMTLDAAILDTLHGHARDLDTTVTALISDPAAGYVAWVEVTPDGSSTLLDQHEPGPDAAGVVPEPVPVPREHDEQPIEPAGEPVAETGYDVPAPLIGAAAGAVPSWADEDEDEDEGVSLADDREDDDAGEDEYLVGRENEGEYEYESEYEGDEENRVDERNDIDEGKDVDDEEDEDDFGVNAYPVAEQRQAASPPSPGPAATTPRLPNILRRNGARQSDDEYESPGLLHNPVVVGPMALVVTALVVVPLVILGSGGSDDGGGQKEAAGAGTETSSSPHAGSPAPSASSITGALSPSPSTTASPHESKDPKKGDKDTGPAVPPPVTVTANPPRTTVTAKPPRDTAATAVNRLARNDASGRHICYSAYVSGQGWQKPVCDGTMAGTVGQNRPIKALNIAVSGADGSAAVAFLHDPGSTNGQGKFEKSWTAIKASGKNNYIGSTAKGAPNMSGFAINIGSGQICQRSKVNDWNWGDEKCVPPRPELNFGGTLENDHWLEAVKLTV
ncbi:hypothetical protein ACFVT5_19395 [Streptomyces sp. NPDC058001]|uniref:hypothetical protein n=1 Tax=Streptomyces sp. NPDC058001 TaxID=3346300 RepID=UPI0036E70510